MAGEATGIDLERGRCCLSDGRRRWTPEQFEPKIAWLQEFFALWPDHVTASLEERT